MNVLEQADDVSKLRDWSWHNIYQFRNILLFIKKWPLMVQYPFNIWMNSPYAYPQRFRGFLDRDTIFLLEHQADSVCYPSELMKWGPAWQSEHYVIRVGIARLQGRLFEHFVTRRCLYLLLTQRANAKSRQLCILQPWYLNLIAVSLPHRFGTIIYAMKKM